jgi:ribose-phosphate pyrophosphokinase
MPKPPSAIVSLGAGAAFADRVAEALGAPRIAVEERLFEDGEMKVRPLDVVRGRAVYLVQSLDGGPEAAVHDRLCRVLFLIGAMRDAGATEVRAVFPYLAYARKDRRTKPQDPLTLRYFAQLLEAVGIASVMALEVHDLPAFENAFRVPTVPLDTRRLFIDYLLSSLRGGELGTREPLVVSPDPGGIKRAQLFQEMLERRLNRPIGRAVADKRRSRVASSAASSSTVRCEAACRSSSTILSAPAAPSPAPRRPWSRPVRSPPSSPWRTACSRPTRPRSSGRADRPAAGHRQHRPATGGLRHCRRSRW